MDAQGNVYVGDRSNARVQVFDNDLNFKAIYDNVGNPWAVCISPGPHQYLFVSNSIPDNGTRAVSRTSPARSTRWSSTARSSASSARPGKQLGEFSTVHEIDCRNPERAVRLGDHRVARAEDHPASAPRTSERAVAQP